ncbi:MAG: hypothetical protein V9E88_07965 [Ferruginibacter sp.]
MKIANAEKVEIMGIFDVIHDDFGRIEFFFGSFMLFAMVFCAMILGQDGRIKQDHYKAENRYQ